jgi:hypothetical protein
MRLLKDIIFLALTKIKNILVRMCYLRLGIFHTTFNCFPSLDTKQVREVRAVRWENQIITVEGKINSKPLHSVHLLAKLFSHKLDKDPRD